MESVKTRRPTKRFEDLREFVREKVKKIVPEDFVEDFVNDESMKKITVAFTHISVSPQSYDLYETKGDAVIKAAFYDYISESLPWVNRSSSFTELESYYNSKHFFNQMSRSEGLTNFLLKSKDIPLIDPIAEDLFESWNGVMFELGNEIGMKRIGIPIGYLVVKNYLTLLLNQIEIDPDRAFGSFQNQLSEMGTKMGFKINELVNAVPDKKVETYYYVYRYPFSRIIDDLEGDSDKIRNFSKLYKDYYMFDKKTPLDENEKKRHEALEAAFAKRHLADNAMDSLLLGQGIGNDKEDSRSLAARASLQYLYDNFGINREISNQILQETKIKNPELADLMRRVREKYPEFRVDSKAYGENSLRLLVATPKKGKPLNLATTYEDKDLEYDEARLNLFRKAVENMENRGGESSTTSSRRPDTKAES